MRWEACPSALPPTRYGGKGIDREFLHSAYTKSNKKSKKPDLLDRAKCLNLLVAGGRI